MHYNSWGWDGWVGMGLWMLLGIVVLVVVVWLVVRALQVGPGAPPPRESMAPREPTPEELLRARFARGEIDEEEYRRRLAVLREGR